jgi:hypothetical protein
LAVASRKLRLARDSPLGLCAKIGLFQSSKSVFGQASISARKPIAGESNHALSRKRRCWHCKPSVPREIRLIPEHIAGSALELESNCISISLRGFFAVQWSAAPFRAPQLRQELKQDLGRQRQCIPLSRIALRQGASQGEIDPEGAVAAEISSSLGGMLSRMPAISPRRPGRLAAFSF